MVNELNDQNVHSEIPAEPPPMADEEYEQLIEDYSNLSPPSEGEVLRGRIIDITATEAVVDFNYKNEGVLPIDQITAPDGSLRYNVGDELDVIVERYTAPQAGYVLLSHRQVLDRQAWDNLERAYKEDLLISCRLLERVKGGFSVDVGVEAFLPASQLEPPAGADPDNLIGHDMAVKIVKMNRRRGNVVVSRKAAVDAENRARKTATLAVLEEGSVMRGVVKNLTSYGAFIDLGGLDGLLHVSDISYGRVTHPQEVLKPGDEVTVKILKFDPDKERVSLGMKQLQDDPWETAVQRYTVGSKVIGRVVSVTDYGAFVELEAGVEGLIHITEMTWSRRLKHPKKVVSPGDPVEAVVLAVSPEEKRISLGIKQLEADPWTTVDQRYALGSVVEGRVRKLTDFGAFIEIEEGIDGLIHISDLSWTERTKHPSEILKKGQIVQAVILNIDAKGRRMSLGIKQLTPHPWELFFQTHQVGDTVTGKVVRGASFGVFVELADGVEALCHNSEISSYSTSTDQPALTIGETYEFKVIKMVESERKIGLSLASAAGDEERSRLEDYNRRANAATLTLEEVMNLRDSESGSN